MNIPKNILIRVKEAKMISAQLHPQETLRIQALQSYQILDTLPEENFDELVALASEICETPISLVSLIDENRQWFKAKVGLGASETARTVAFCAHAILQDDLFIVENSLEDERFKDNPLAVDAPHVIFYAGAPLINKDGFPLGTLCAIDSKPRKLNDFQKKALVTISHQVVAQMELRLKINEQKEQLAKLEKLNHDKDKFFSIVSHDLRSPFHGILGLTTLILDDFDALDRDEILDYTQDIQNSAQSAYKLVDNLLNWSMIEGGVLKPDIREIALIDIFQDIKHSLKSFADQKKIQLKISGDLSCSVIGDRNMLRSTLLNLASNALKFTSATGNVELKAQKEMGEVTLKVQDSGQGMSAEQLHKLKKCGELNSTIGTVGEPGTGLGLKLCFQFVELMNSKLEVQTVMNSGTTFEFKLPLA
jgi:signal transduction histidine kinase